MKIRLYTLLLLFTLHSHPLLAGSKDPFCYSLLTQLNALTFFSADRRHYDCFLWGYQRDTNLYYNLHLEGVERLPLGRNVLAFTDLDALRTRTILIFERAGFSPLSEALKTMSGDLVAVKRQCLDQIIGANEIRALRRVQRDVFLLAEKPGDLYFLLNKPAYIRDPWQENARWRQIREAGGYLYMELRDRKFYKIDRIIGDGVRAFLMPAFEFPKRKELVQVRQLSGSKDTLYSIDVSSEAGSPLIAPGDLVQHVDLLESFRLKFRDDTFTMLIAIPLNYSLVFE